MGQTRQARAPATQPFAAEAFAPSDRTVLRWLGMAGFLVNSRGTTIVIDPVLGGFDMPVMIDMPVAAADIPHLDAVLVTHSDNDHYSVPTCHPQGYQDCFTNFVRDVHAAVHGDPPDGLPTFADGLRAASLTEAVLQSARTGEWVEPVTAQLDALVRSESDD
jgi:hypothetical protein